MDQIDHAALSVLSSKVLPRAAPHQAKLSEVYADSSQCVSVLAEATNQRGQIKVSANSKSFGTASNFDISTSSLLCDLKLYLSLTVAANGIIMQDGWGFNCIRSLEVSFANSLAQNITIDGQALRDLALLYCKDQKQREQMLRAAGKNQGVGAANACIPLSFLNFGIGGAPQNFPLDMSTLSGPLRIQVNLANAYNVIRRDAVGDTVLPAALDDMYITATTSFLQDAAFSVRNAQMAIPDLIYNIPARYVQTNTYVQAVAAYTDRFTLNVNSCPAGQLQYIIVDIKPLSAVAGESYWPGLAAKTSSPLNESLPCSYLELQYSGQSLFRTEDSKVRKSFYQSCFGDSLEYEIDKPRQDAVNPAAYLATLHHHLIGSLNVIPMMYDGVDVIHTNKLENLPSYGGASLSFIIQAEAPKEKLSSNVFGETDYLEYTGQAITATSLQIKITWVLSSLVMIQNQVADLQL